MPWSIGRSLLMLSSLVLKFCSCSYNSFNADTLTRISRQSLKKKRVTNDSNDGLCPKRKGKLFDGKAVMLTYNTKGAINALPAFESTV